MPADSKHTNLRVYNSLSRSKETFVPLKAPFVGIYVCGPTVYGDPHLGHAKSYVSFDVVVRYLRYLGYKVRYVQNITDVGHLTDDADSGEDKLGKQALAEKLEPMEVAEKYTYNFFRDMDLLSVRRPDISPRATGHIPEQIAMIEQLLERGHAYESKGNIYFSVRSNPEYGKLSGRKIEEAATGTRIEAASDKQDPEDFALWKKADAAHLMKWPSPWGLGYPGWHIECSAMSVKYLGETFDIHGGGIDNQFPHHECEIAQSECASGKTFARFWMHNNMVTLNGQKMGKSLGNAISLQQFFSGEHDLLSRAWPPEVIRFFLLQSHYRGTTDFSEGALGAAETGMKSLYQAVAKIRETKPGNGGAFPAASLKENLEAALNDDFNTAQAIAVLFEAAKTLRKSIEAGESPSNMAEVQQIFYSFMHEVMGIWPGSNDTGESPDKTLESVLQFIIEMRAKVRSEKNYEMSDYIRDGLKKNGIILKDSKNGTTWEIE